MFRLHPWRFAAFFGAMIAWTIVIGFAISADTVNPRDLFYRGIAVFGLGMVVAPLVAVWVNSIQERTEP